VCETATWNTAFARSTDTCVVFIGLLLLVAFKGR